MSQSYFHLCTKKWEFLKSNTQLIYLKSSQHLNNCEGSVDELVEAYNNGVQSIINHHLITLRLETP